MNDQNLVQEFLLESYENLEQLDRDLVALEAAPGDRERLDRIFRTVHTLKGSCGFFGFARLAALSHHGENLLSRLREGTVAVGPAVTSALLALGDAVRAVLGDVRATGAEGERDHAALLATLAALAEGRGQRTEDRVGEPGTKEVLNLEDLEAAGGIRTGRRHILSLLVENKPGVLARIAGLFARRGFNIDSLAVGPTADLHISRITLTVDGAAQPIDQVTKQLHKLVNVIKIRDLEPAECVARELSLFKVSCSEGESRAQVMQFSEIFRGKVVDVSKRSVTIEITGTDDKIEAFEEMVRPFGLIEMVRTGEIAIARGRSAT